MQNMATRAGRVYAVRFALETHKRIYEEEYFCVGPAEKTRRAADRADETYDVIVLPIDHGRR